MTIADVQPVLDRLSAHERAAVRLRLEDGLSDAQIATVLGCRPETATAMVRRGLHRVRDELARDH